MNKFWKKTTRRNIILINYGLRAVETANHLNSTFFFILLFALSYKLISYFLFLYYKCFSRLYNVYVGEFCKNIWTLECEYDVSIAYECSKWKAWTDQNCYRVLNVVRNIFTEVPLSLDKLTARPMKFDLKSNKFTILTSVWVSWFYVTI